MLEYGGVGDIVRLADGVAAAKGIAGEGQAVAVEGVGSQGVGSQRVGSRGIGGGFCGIGFCGVRRSKVDAVKSGEVESQDDWLEGVRGRRFKGIGARRFDRGLLSAYREAKTTANQHQYKQSFDQQRAGFS